MTTETFSISSGSFGFIMGGITLLGLIINLARFYLPSKKIKELEALLEETEAFFNKAVEDGLLTEPGFVQETAEALATLRRTTCSLQSSAYSATTMRKDYVEFFRGTSMAIGTTCQSLKKLRAEVISSSEEKRRLLEMNSVPQLCLPTLPLKPETRVLDRLATPPAAEITRPRSCPPSMKLSVGSSDYNQSIVTTRSNLSTQADSDVQSMDVQNCASVDYTSANFESERSEV